MLTAIIGLLAPFVGALIRLAPELMKFFDKKLERAHELLMQDKALEFEKLRGSQRMQELSSELDRAQLEAIGKASTAQLRKTGIRWVDAVNALVRPTVTYIFLAMYCGVKVCALVAAMNGGYSFITALPAIWDVDIDGGLFGSILGFWFVSRVYDKKGAA